MSKTCPRGSTIGPPPPQTTKVAVSTPTIPNFMIGSSTSQRKSSNDSSVFPISIETATTDTTCRRAKSDCSDLSNVRNSRSGHSDVSDISKMGDLPDFFEMNDIIDNLTDSTKNKCTTAVSDPDMLIGKGGSFCASKLSQRSRSD